MFSSSFYPFFFFFCQSILRHISDMSFRSDMLWYTSLKIQASVSLRNCITQLTVFLVWSDTQSLIMCLHLCPFGSLLIWIKFQGRSLCFIWLLCLNQMKSLSFRATLPPLLHAIQLLQKWAVVLGVAHILVFSCLHPGSSSVLPSSFK